MPVNVWANKKPKREFVGHRPLDTMDKPEAEMCIQPGDEEHKKKEHIEKTSEEVGLPFQK